MSDTMLVMIVELSYWRLAWMPFGPVYHAIIYTPEGIVKTELSSEDKHDE